MSIVVTCVQASTLIEALSCMPIPPAPTIPKMVEPRTLMSQRKTPTPAIVGKTWGKMP